MTGPQRMSDSDAWSTVNRLRRNDCGSWWPPLDGNVSPRWPSTVLGHLALKVACEKGMVRPVRLALNRHAKQKILCRQSHKENSSRLAIV